LKGKNIAIATCGRTQNRTPRKNVGFVINLKGDVSIALLLYWP